MKVVSIFEKGIGQSVDGNEKRSKCWTVLKTLKTF